MAFYNDTLYIGCGLEPTVDGQFINGVAKFIAPTYENNCSGSTAITDMEGSATEQLVHLGAGQFLLRGQIAKGSLTIFGATGQLLGQVTISEGTPFDLGVLSPGFYVARLPGGSFQRFVME